MNSIIIGQGEIGKSLEKVLSPYHPTYIRDIKSDLKGEYDIMHIAFPYSNEFLNQVKHYQLDYSPKYTIIHSTVPVGTSRMCNALHSPVIGLHPFLEESIKTFTKFIGGKDASQVADYFRRANIKTYLTDKQETTELMKILSTTNHGLNIEFTKEVKRLCDQENVPFEMWTLWTDNYNKGYEELGHPEYKRPNLIPVMKKIGGHCVLPNTKLIKSKFADFIRSLNE